MPLKSQGEQSGDEKRMPPSPNMFIVKLEPYKAVPQDVWIGNDARQTLKLDWNESTCISRPLQRDVADLLMHPEYIHWYPDVNCTDVTKAIADYLSLTPPDILVFSGSDDALSTICLTYLTADDYVCTVHPSYDNFRIFVERVGAVFVPIHLENPARFDHNEFIEKIQQLSAIPKIIYLVSPNNPIGYEIDLNARIEILNHFPESIIVIDEAYIDFTDNSCYQLINIYPNLIVTRTFSKAFGLAGLRIGYAVSDMRNQANMTKVRNGKNVTMIAQKAAALILSRLDEVQRHIGEICEARSWFIRSMRREGAIVYDSAANFVLMKIPSPQDVVLWLRKKGIYIRDRSWIFQLEGCVRITIGTRKQMRRVLQSFKELDRSLWIFPRKKS